MELTYTTVNKSSWGEGPWVDEPDKMQWKDAQTGLPCLAKRHQTNGHWCGYVGVSEGHPFFEVPYEDIDGVAGNQDHERLSVHGGITYTAHCQEGDEAEAICHIPDPGEPDHVWWLGFDFAHAGDILPGMQARLREAGYERDIPCGYEGDTYKTLSYVREECARLAAQLAEL